MESMPTSRNLSPERRSISWSTGPSSGRAGRRVASTTEASHVPNGLGCEVGARHRPRPSSVADQPARELGEGCNMAVIAVAQVIGVDVNWVQPGSLCSEHVELDGVANVDAARWLNAERVECQ